MSCPVEIIDHCASGVLEIGWDDGSVSHLPHALLRSHCRCAACEQRRRHAGTAPQPDAALRLLQITPIADKGLNLAFSDGHDRGIYPWNFLRQLGAH